MIRSEDSALLVDAGLSCKRLTEKLAALGQPVDSLAGVCITHEHSDHINGIATMWKKHQVPLFANMGTSEAVRNSLKKSDARFTVFNNENPFRVGNLWVKAFQVQHDARDPVGFIISDGGSTVGVMSDSGIATHLMRHSLRRCHAIVVETNHDTQMLQDAERPWHLKQRISGRMGHLSNDQAAELIGEVAGPNLKTIFMSHLSDECNCPELAERVMREKLDTMGRSDIRLVMTWPDKATPCIKVDHDPVLELKT